MSITVGVLPKSTRSQYFEECRAGAEAAARELGFVLSWEGPEQSSASGQAEVVKQWMRDGVAAIAASVEHAATLSPLLREARARGIRVLTWDADGDPDARDFTLVAATSEAIAPALSFTVGRVLGGAGAFAVITSSLTAPNQAAWLAQLRARVEADYRSVRLADVRECHDVEEQARQRAAEILQAHPDVRLLVGLCSPAVPGAAAAHALATGALGPGASSFKGGSQGSVVVRDDEIRLGRVHVVSAGNLSQFLA